MSAAALIKVTAAGSSRLLADVRALDACDREQADALSRLEAAVGPELAVRLVSALSNLPPKR
jgi:hypothetical protein